MSPGAERGPRRLPPLARGRDWLAAGLGAGLCLGAAEALGLQAQAIELRSTHALALLAADTLAVAILSLPLALATALRRTRLRRSTVMAGIAGPLLLAPVLSRLVSVARDPGPEGVPVALGAAAALAVACGLLAARAGSRLEGAGIPIPGPPLWGTLAFLVAAGGVFRTGGPLEPTAGVLVALAGWVLLLALLAAFLVVVAARRETIVPWPWGRTLLALAAAGGGIALTPQLLPWILMEPPGSVPEARRPDVLVIDLGTFAAGEGPALRHPGAGAGEHVAPNLTLLASAGVLYPHVVAALPSAPPSPSAPAIDWLRLPDGVPIARALRAQGYVTRLAGVPDGRDALPPGFEPADGSSDGGDRQLALRASVGGSLIASLGVERARSPAYGSYAAGVTAEARRRIAGVRGLESDRALLLLVDYRAAQRDVETLDDEVGALIGFLADLGLDENARLVVTWSEAVPSQQPAGVPPPAWVLRTLVRPEPSTPHPRRGEVVAGPALASDVAQQITETGAQAARPR